MKANETVTEIPSMHFTRNEKIEIFLNMVIVVGCLFFVYFSLNILYIEFLSRPMPFIQDSDVTTFEYFEWTLTGVLLVRDFFKFFMIIFGTIFSYARFRKKVETIRLRHVVDYVTYIAQGHYDIKIPEVEMGNLTIMIRSINRLVESTVRAREEELKVEKTKDELIANVGHDLRTPLTSIIGYLSLIEEEKYQSHQQLLQFTHNAYDKAILMQHLVNDLFEYASSRLTTYELEKVQVPVSLYLEQISADFDTMAIQKSIQIVVEVSPENLVAYFDPEKMVRVFNNLISNALKYGIGATKIRLLAWENMTDNQVIFEVRNDGALLEEDELEKIFQRSYRSDASRNFDIPGTGLGLAIARNIIETHEGKIYALIDQNEMVFRIEMDKNEEITNDFVVSNDYE